MTVSVKQWDNSWETKCVLSYAKKNNITVEKCWKRADASTNTIPVGSIDWVEQFVALPKPAYYPEWLSELFHRKIWETSQWPLWEKVFIKPADKPKRFTGKTTTGKGSNHGRKKGPFWCSEIVKFTDEWRLYVTDGEVKFVGKYGEGLQEELVYPTLQFPTGWCGTVDLGLVNGEITLVEAGEPYSMGWYGGEDEGDIYVEWLLKGWLWMEENLCLTRK